MGGGGVGFPRLYSPKQTNQNLPKFSSQAVFFSLEENGSSFNHHLFLVGALFKGRCLNLMFNEISHQSKKTTRICSMQTLTSKKSLNLFNWQNISPSPHGISRDLKSMVLCRESNPSFLEGPG